MDPLHMLLIMIRITVGELDATYPTPESLGVEIEACSAVVGFMDRMVSLASWTGLGSNAYPAEILSCVKEKEPLGCIGFRPTRSPDLDFSPFGKCASSVEHHPKATLVIRNYEEGKGFDRCCGFECLRLLAREFSIKTRTELLFFRSQLAISAKSIPECVRKVQSELYIGAPNLSGLLNLSIQPGTSIFLKRTKSCCCCVRFPNNAVNGSYFIPPMSVLTHTLSQHFVMNHNNEFGPT